MPDFIIETDDDAVAMVICKLRDISNAARAYVEARRKNEAAEPVDWERARTEVDRTYHELLLACGYEE